MKIETTKNYGMFSLEQANRNIDLDRTSRKKLRASMIAYGYIPAFPIVCYRKGGKLWVKDGQHRLNVARELGIAVYYIVCDSEFDVALVNRTVEPWKLEDYAGSFAKQGKDDYQQVMDFATCHGLPISIAAAMLSNNGPGNTSNISSSFKSGNFEVRTSAMAEIVAGVYGKLISLNPKIKSASFIKALFSVCMIEGIDTERLVSGAKRQPELLVKYGSADGFLGMLEQIYNFGRRIKEPIKIAAENAMKKRNPTNHIRPNQPE